ncbi:Ionotropic receptor 107 [Blattella germanica]|nr:Ionotropic receptor 107 [Blattella germanica]
MHFLIETFFLLVNLQYAVTHFNSKLSKPYNRGYLELILQITESFPCLNIQVYNEIHDELYVNILKHLSIPTFVGNFSKHSLCTQQFLIVENETLFIETVSFDILVILLVLDSNCFRMNEMKSSCHGVGKILVVCAFKNTVHLVTNSKLTSNLSEFSELINESTKQLPNYFGKSLLVFTFNCPLFSYGTAGDIDSSSNNIGKLDGIEMKIFLEVSKKLNFTWKLREPTELNKWGFRERNGTWSGGIKGPLANGTADVGFCCLWLIVPQFQDFDLTFSWDILCNTFVVPRPRRLNNVGAIFRPFENPLWCALMLVTFLTAFIMQRLQGVSCRTHLIKNERDLVKDSLDLLGILMLASFPPLRSECQERRHICAWWTVFALLISTAYSSSLVSHLTKPQFEPLLDSVRDLVLANIKWSGSETFAESSILSPEDHAAYGFTLDGGIPFFLEGGVPMNPSAYPFLRVMKRCASRYYISLGLAKNSPYTSAFNKVIFRLIESGVIKHWKETIANRHIDPQMSKLFMDTVAHSLEPQPLKLVNIFGVFILLSCGLFIGTFVFILEKCLMINWKILIYSTLVMLIKE